MGETLAVDGAGVVVVLLVVVLLAAIGIAGRRVLLDRGGGTVECGLRRPRTDGSWPRWRLGVARYRRDELWWHQIFGMRLRPDEVVDRGGLTVLDRRGPVPAESSSLGADTVIVRCRTSGAARPAEAMDPVADDDAAGSVELAMSEAAMTGFLAWLEAAPRYPYRRRLPPEASGRRRASTARRHDRRSRGGPG